ncbi:hypothetical protein ALON55S_01659 [Alishewanella longhuensis]
MRFLAYRLADEIDQYRFWCTILRPLTSESGFHTFSSNEFSSEAPCDQAEDYQLYTTAVSCYSKLYDAANGVDAGGFSARHYATQGGVNRV